MGTQVFTSLEQISNSGILRNLLSVCASLQRANKMLYILNSHQQEIKTLVKEDMLTVVRDWGVVNIKE